MSTALAAPHGFDRDYWLSHSDGFRVDGDGGRLGFVDHVEQDGRGHVVLAVRAGILGRLLLLVDTDEVDFVVPRAKRLWLHSPVRILGTRRAE